jgi:hypothetical protein
MAPSSTLNMEASRISETCVDYHRTTGVISQRTQLIISIAVRTSNLKRSVSFGEFHAPEHTARHTSGRISTSGQSTKRNNPIYVRNDRREGKRSSQTVRVFPEVFHFNK